MKNRPISKGLLNRVALYIRDNSVNGEYIQDEETMAYYLGVTVNTVRKVIEQLLKEKKIVAKQPDDPNAPIPIIYIYKGEGAMSDLALELGSLHNKLQKLFENIDGKLDDEKRELILNYAEKVQKLLDDYQEMHKKLENYKEFKESIIRVMEAHNGMFQIIARKKPV
ncbi:hypothetical protein M1N12_00725 [Peptococcaceae bacterium]|nr:hypothetical protein [Peptococcaceae bacterium]MCL0052698.1 hypothetical protein [Peptococcaceae bacterium]MCL0063284.1 hypothetical protein [Peptococcaceae bacterium]